jgi:hypothetical protein
MAKHVFSTLSAGTEYTEWVTQPGVNTVLRKVVIRGGAGIATQGNGPNIYTPFGVRTEVSDDDAEFLAKHGIFQLHQKHGHVRIESIAKDADKVAEKMEADTGSKPVTPAQVKKDAEEAAKKSGLSPTETLQVVQNKGK